MKKHQKYQLALLLTLITICAEARSYYFSTYEVEEGLSNNNVTCCIQDHFGFMWFGTRDGLNRFDGNKFHVIKNQSTKEDGLISSWITSFAISPSNDLWIGTNMGVQKYNYQTDSFSLLPFTKGISCSNLMFDRQGDLWMILTNYSLIRYNEQTGIHQNYQYKGNDPITLFHITKQNQVWATTANGYIVFFDRDNNNFRPLNNFRHNSSGQIENITAIWASPSNEILLIGTGNNGVKQIDIQTGNCKDILSKEKSTPFDIRCFFETTDDEIWIGTYSGIYIYLISSGNISHIQQDKSDPYSLSNNAIKQFGKDWEGGLWICTDNGGVNYIPPYQKFRKHYNIPGKKTINGDIIHDICQDDNNNIWIGTEDAGLSKFNPKNNTYTVFQDDDGLSQNCIHGLAAAGNYLWIGTHVNGIDIMDIRTEKIVKHYTIGPNASLGKNSIIVYLYKTRKGDLLVATATGLYKFNPQRDQFECMPQFPSHCRIQTIFEDHEEVIWAGTFNNGIYYYNTTTQQHGEFILDTMKTSAHRTINHIHEDRQNNIWFATAEGLKVYNRNTHRTTRYSISDGMPSNVTYRIEEDQKNRIWASTTNGLAMLNSTKQEIKVFKTEHGLTSNQLNYNSSTRSSDGKFYFGTLKGMISFHPDNLQDFPILPRVYITQINYTDPNSNTMEQQNITFLSQITLKHNQSTFYIDYAALSYQAPQITKYAYCMEGLNSKWYHVVGENRAYFTKLPPGSYTFKVKAANISGIWDEQPTTIQILILPPWWLSQTAYLLYTILFSGALYLLAYAINKRNKRKMQQKIHAFENEKEKELYQAKIDFFINIAHEIRTPLTLIKSPLDKIFQDQKLPQSAKNYLDIVNKNANRLLDLANQLLDFRKTEIEGYKLNFVQIDIISLFHETLERFKDTAELESKELVIEKEIESLYVFIDKEACIKIFSNLLSNAIKYARSKIVVRFNLSGNEKFTINFINDGTPIPEEIKDKIFEPFFRDESSIHKSGTGLGLPLARSLAEMHNGALTFENSSYGQIIFRLCLPVNQANSLKIIPEENCDTAKNIAELYDNQKPSHPTILIVEDNKEMRCFIGQEINVTYNVITASNGKEAVDKLKENVIQLVISDIMMPIMDGFALLKEIKNNFEFSHIPIILLTAQNTIQSRIEGLELGADAYIEKPFSIDLLMSQIVNLLNNRNIIRTYYSNSPIANIKSMAYTKADEKFLKKLNDIIYIHINDVDLDVDMIATLMNLSRPTLYRKINGISNLTPNELIKISRLKKAAEQGKRV